MVFGLILVILAGLIAFFHYIQGWFTATVSAVIGALAAVIAIGYHEDLVDFMLRGKLADQAHAIALIVLFSGTYILLRVLFDLAVPGYVFLGVLPDKIGAAVMGIIAAVFPIGILAIAAQTMPFAPSIMGFARQEVTGQRVEGVAVNPIAGGRTLDGRVQYELKERNLDTARQRGMLLPFDEWTLALASRVSAGGSMAGTRTIESVHPDYLFQLFASRLGLQVGAKITAFPINNTPSIKVDGIWRLSERAGLPQVDGDVDSVRPSGEKVEATFRPEPGNLLLVVRATLSRDASDADNNVRFSPASVRIKAGNTNHHPIGTLHEAKLLIANRADDPLILPGDTSVDLVFAIPAADIAPAAADPKAVDLKIPAGTFIEFKRLSRVSLADTAITPADSPTTPLAPAANTGLFRKAGVMKNVDKILYPNKQD
jgi:hypothetical protein